MACLFSGLDTDLYGDTCFDGHLSVAYAGDVMLTKAGCRAPSRHATATVCATAEAAYLRSWRPGRPCRWNNYGSQGLREQWQLGHL